MIPGLIVAKAVGWFAPLIQLDPDAAGRIILEDRNMVQDQRRLTESLKGIAAQNIVAESRDQTDIGTERGGNLSKVVPSPPQPGALGK